jgi:predicted phosphodiesterase
LALLQEVGAVCIAGNHDRAVSGQITIETFSRTAARAAAWTRARLTGDEIAFLSALPVETCLEGRLVAVHGALHPKTGREIVRLNSDERRQLSFDALVASPSGARICAFGHTHQLGVFELRQGVITERDGDEIRLHEDAYYLVNPGSVGQPRTVERRATYLVLDLNSRVALVRRVNYDAATALAKARRAGLLPYSAYLPPRLRRSLRRCVRALGF